MLAEWWRARAGKQWAKRNGYVVNQKRNDQIKFWLILIAFAIGAGVWVWVGVQTK